MLISPDIIREDKEQAAVPGGRLITPEHNVKQIAPSVLEQFGKSFVSGVTLGKIPAGEITVPGAALLGELGGLAVPITAIGQSARFIVGLAKLPRAVGVASETISGTIFGALEEIPDEKSRAANILETSALFGMIGVVGAGLRRLKRVAKDLKANPGPLTQADVDAIETVAADLGANAEKTMPELSGMVKLAAEEERIAFETAAAQLEKSRAAAKAAEVLPTTESKKQTIEKLRQVYEGATEKELEAMAAAIKVPKPTVAPRPVTKKPVKTEKELREEAIAKLAERGVPKPAEPAESKLRDDAISKLAESYEGVPKSKGKPEASLPPSIEKSIPVPDYLKPTVIPKDLAVTNIERLGKELPAEDQAIVGALKRARKQWLKAGATERLRLVQQTRKPRVLLLPEESLSTRTARLKQPKEARDAVKIEELTENQIDDLQVELLNGAAVPFKDASGQRSLLRKTVDDFKKAAKLEQKERRELKQFGREFPILRSPEHVRLEERFIKELDKAKTHAEAGRAIAKFRQKEADLLNKELVKTGKKDLGDRKSGRYAVGMALGVEVDENGEFNFDAQKALLGLTAGMVMFKMAGNPKIMQGFKDFFKATEKQAPKGMPEARTVAFDAARQANIENSFKELNEGIGYRGKFNTALQVFSSIDGYLRRSPTGKILANLFKTTRDEGEKLFGNWSNKLFPVVKSLKGKKEWENLRAVIDDPVAFKPMNDRVAAAVPIVKGILEEVKVAAKGQKILVGEIKDYWPIVNDLMLLKNDRATYIRAVNEIQSKLKFKSEAEASEWIKVHLGPERNTEATIKRLMEGKMSEQDAADALKNYIDSNTRRTVGNLERTRELHLNAARLSPQNELETYLARASRGIKEVEHYGKELENIDRLILGMRLNGEDFKFAERAKKHIIGTNEEAEWMKLFQPMMNIQIMTKLGFAQIANATESINLLMLANSKSMLKGLNFMMTTEGKEFVRKSAAWADTIQREIFDMSRTGFSQKLATKFLKYSGFTFTEKFNRAWGAATGKFYAPEAAAKFFRNPNSRRWRISMEELGLNPKEVLAQGGKLTEDQILTASKRLADTAFKRYGSLDLPMFFSHPLGRLMLQFKRFAFTQGRLMKNELFVKRNPRAWAMFLAAFPIVGEGLANTRSAISGYDRPEGFGLDRETLERLLDNYAWLGSFGVFYDAIRAARYKGGPEHYILGPTFSDFSKMASSLYQSVDGGETTPFANFLKREVPVFGRTRLAKK